MIASGWQCRSLKSRGLDASLASAARAAAINHAWGPWRCVPLWLGCRPFGRPAAIVEESPVPSSLCRPGSSLFIAFVTAAALCASNAWSAVATQFWPGSASVATVDPAGALGGDVSGLDYEGTGTPTPGVLWAVDNSDSFLVRLLWNGTNWVRDTANGWSAGKTLHYPGGL